MMATARDKFVEAVKKMSRDEKMDKICGQVCDWDIDAMVDWIQSELEARLVDLDDDELNEVYLTDFDTEECDYDDDEEEEVSLVCNNDTCPMTAWGINHHVDCPQRS